MITILFAFLGSIIPYEPRREIVVILAIARRLCCGDDRDGGPIKNVTDASTVTKTPEDRPSITFET
jgi:hypothetical protein